MTEALVLLSTAPNEGEALRLARALVEEGLAACVNLVPGVRSIYRWEGQTCDAARREALTQRLLELHPYECPEALALPVVAGSEAYLAWLQASCGEPS